ncbi:hypothetical protein [Vreelandella maris]
MAIQPVGDARDPKAEVNTWADDTQPLIALEMIQPTAEAGTKRQG